MKLPPSPRFSLDLDPEDEEEESLRAVVRDGGRLPLVEIDGFADEDEEEEEPALVVEEGGLFLGTNFF